MKYEIIYVKYFNDSEKERVAEYVEKNINDFEDLHSGINYAVDVSKAIGRTANVDIEVYE